MYDFNLWKESVECVEALHVLYAHSLQQAQAREAADKWNSGKQDIPAEEVQLHQVDVSVQLFDPSKPKLHWKALTHSTQWDIPFVEVQVYDTKDFQNKAWQTFQQG